MIASLGMQFHLKSDLTTIKFVIFMRAIQAFIVLMHTKLNKLAGKTKTDDFVDIPVKGYLFATAGIILHVWTLNKELYAIGPSTVERLSSLLQVTQGELIWLKCGNTITET